MSMTIQSSVKDKILATLSETSKVENAPAEMLRDLDQQMEKRADDVKPRRVRAMAMTIQYGVRGMLLTAQSEAFKEENVPLDEKDRYNADIRATNIILQGLPKDIYSLSKSYTDAKEIMENVTDAFGRI
ncbi:hypothetical protein Tco_0907897 [Tanacetum coccineum]|uniref:Uncharacterized protein n=1 Tax=Tanacetum coccineum TaxID=301880 RepID=A0ABQ5CM10_9ASTR